MISYFSSLIVVYAILKGRKFGIGLLLWTPYAIISFTDSGSFLGVAYFCLPWMIINAFFGGYCAYTIHYFSSRRKSHLA